MSLLPYHKGNKTNFINLLFTLTRIGACPSDAVEEVKSVSDYVSPFPGGHGCVRDVIQQVMKSRGDWVFDVAGYTAKF